MIDLKKYIPYKKEDSDMVGFERIESTDDNPTIGLKVANNMAQIPVLLVIGVCLIPVYMVFALFWSLGFLVRKILKVEE